MSVALKQPQVMNLNESLRGRYRRRLRGVVQAPRTQAAAERASRGVGTGDTRGRRYRSLALTQRHVVKTG